MRTLNYSYMMTTNHSRYITVRLYISVWALSITSKNSFAVINRDLSSDFTYSSIHIFAINSSTTRRHTLHNVRVRAILNLY